MDISHTIVLILLRQLNHPQASYQVDEGQDGRSLGILDRFFQCGEVKSLERHVAGLDDEVASLQQLLQDVIANIASEDDGMCDVFL